MSLKYEPDYPPQVAPTIGARDLSMGGEAEVVQEKGKVVQEKKVREKVGREADDEWDSVEAAVLLPGPGLLLDDSPA